MDAAKAVLQSLAQLIRLAWLDDPQFQTLLDDLKSLGALSLDHLRLAYLALDSLIHEMGCSRDCTPSRSFLIDRHRSQARRVQTSFKDRPLAAILTYALNSLEKLLEKANSTGIEGQETMSGLLMQCLCVLNGCLNFDFTGSLEEAIEDAAYSQMPLSWAELMLNATLFQPVFTIACRISSDSHKLQADRLFHV